MEKCRRGIDKPVFIISLDTELAWGRILHPEDGVLTLLQSDAESVRGAINSLLSIFHKYSIPATWVIVGHLFLDRCDREGGLPHKDMLRFRKAWYSFDPCSDIHQAPLYYGKDIVEKILSNPVKHEIGLHSFSHVPFSECSRDVAEAEVKEGVRLARQFGIKLESFVFPENKVGHIDVLKEQGFKIYRGRDIVRSNPKQKFLRRKLNGAMDIMMPRMTEPMERGGMWEIPSAGMFSEIPQIPSGLLLRCRLGLARAIHQNKIFHLWLHPHSLLAQPSLAGHLDQFLKLVSKRRDEGKIQVMTMGELASHLNQGR